MVATPKIDRDHWRWIQIFYSIKLTQISLFMKHTQAYTIAVAHVKANYTLFALGPMDYNKWMQNIHRSAMGTACFFILGLQTKCVTYIKETIQIFFYKVVESHQWHLLSHHRLEHSHLGL